MGDGYPVEVACRVVGVSVSGYYCWRRRPPSARSVRYGLLLDVVAEIHRASRRTYGARRIHAELVHGRGLQVARCTVELIMRRNGLAGLPGRHRYRKVPNLPTATDLVDRRFHRSGPDQLWVTDITEHPTQEGKIYCAVVLDVFSRRVVGWSIDTRPQVSLATSALAMAIENREPTTQRSTPITARNSPLGRSPNAPKTPGWLCRWARSGTASITPSSKRSRMQVELLNRRRWRTRLELSNAIFEYLEIFHNRQRRHSALGMLTPVEYEIRHATTA